jgi:D-sedoheptulose 7-phosphate isomerase
MRAFIREQIEASIAVKQCCLSEPIVSSVQKMSEILVTAFQRGNKILMFGNGGSASDAQHIVAEFVGRYKKERQPLPAIALPCNASNITAIGNDYGYESIFSRQIKALGKEGDVAIGISTSGTSQNVIAALEAAKSQKLVCIGWSGSRVGPMDDLCDVVLHIPSEETARIQECHILLGHILCSLVDQAY